VLEEIRAMVVSTEGFDIRVTMTFGVVDGTQSSIEEMVEGADEKLYYGKQNGRNRVVTEIENAEPEPEPEAPAEEIREKPAAEPEPEMKAEPKKKTTNANRKTRKKNTE
jgi:hypothetical protein